MSSFQRRRACRAAAVAIACLLGIPAAALAANPFPGGSFRPADGPRANNSRSNLPTIGTGRQPFEGGDQPLPPDIDLTADDPDVSISFYEVAGDSRRDLARSLQAQGPGRTRDGKPAPSVTEVAYRHDLGAEGCDPGKARVSYAVVVRLPRLSEGVKLKSDTERWWQFTTRTLKIHERDHIRLARGFRAELETAIRAGTCAGADAEAARVSAAFLKAGARYDELTAHGMKAVGRAR